MMQQGLIFQKGQRQNKITSVPGEEMGGRGSGSHDKTQKARLLWGCIITAKMAGRCSPPYTGRHTHTHKTSKKGPVTPSSPTPPTSLPHCPGNGVMEDRPMPSCLQAWDFPTWRENFCLGNF
jgi:hypothetical protein